jgi:hypothetical protein
MRLQVIYDRAGIIVAAGRATSGIRVSLSSTAQRHLQLSEFESADLDYPQHHTRLREIGMKNKVRSTKDGPVLELASKGRVRPHRSKS